MLERLRELVAAHDEAVQQACELKQAAENAERAAVDLGRKVEYLTRFLEQETGKTRLALKAEGGA